MNEEVHVQVQAHTHENGEVHTVVKGISSDQYDLYKLARVLCCMSGNGKKHVKEKTSVMIFQGDRVSRIKELLDTFGF